MSGAGSKIKKAFQWTLMLALAAVLLYFAFRGVKWEDFLSGIRSCNFSWILVSMLASILAFVIRGLRWRLVMLDGVTIAYLTNFALPRAGELARCGVISATGKASFEAVLGTVVLERSWDMVTYLIILFIVLLAGESSFGKFVSDEVWQPAVDSVPFDILWLIGGIAALCVGACILIFCYRKRLSRYKFFAKLFSLAKGLTGGLTAGLKMRGKWRFLLYTLLLWLCYWIMSYSTILAIPQVAGLNWVDALFLMVVGSLGWIVPVQGGIGAYHFILSLAMSSIYSIPRTSGVIFATISHESQALTMLICGAVSLAAMYISRRKKEKQKSGGYEK